MDRIVRGESPVTKLFPELQGSKYPDFTMTTFLTPSPDVPVRDETFMLDPDVIYPQLLALKCGEPSLTYGPSGCGKTATWMEIAARLGYRLFRVNFDGEIVRADLIGEPTIKGGEVVYRYGLIPTVMRLPAILLLDEIDAIQPSVAFALQRLLEQDGKLLILENGGELITPVPDFRLVATSNTAGMGDESGIYHGTSHLNFSMLDRFKTCVRMGYLSADREKKLLIRKFGNLLAETEVDKFVKVANHLRDGFMQGSLSVPFTTRTLLNWVTKYLVVEDVKKVAEWAFLNRMVEADRKAALNLIDRAF